MSQWAVEFHRAALAEARAAREWYAERSDEAATAFMAEFDRAVEQAATHPHRWARYIHKTQIILFRRFSYLLVYRVIDQKVFVVAVAHSSRRPGYWASRQSKKH